MSMFDTSDRNVIDGHAVADRRPESIINLYDVGAGGRVPKKISQIHELLLDDGRVVYQCAMKPDECHKWAHHATSVNAHLKSHGAKAELSRVKAELDAIQAKQAQTRANRANGAKKAAETRRERKTAAPSPAVADPRAEVAQSLEWLRIRLKAFGDQVDETVTEMRQQVEALMVRVDALPVETLDDETRALLELIKKVQKK